MFNELPAAAVKDFEEYRAMGSKAGLSGTVVGGSDHVFSSTQAP
jgi:hypothetical protein